MFSPGFRWKANTIVNHVSLDSSSSAANLAWIPANKYVTGSIWIPFRIPPKMSSCGIIILAISRAEPPNLMTIAAACWWGWRSVNLTQMETSVMYALKL